MSDKFSFDYCITRKAFEDKLLQDFGHFDVDERNVKEYDCKPCLFVDYYNDGEYIATWCRDRGQIFK